MASTSVARPSYAAVLRIPYARRTFAAALLGRLSYGIVPLAVMLAVTRASGSYAVAGTVMALFSGTSVFLSPARAALIDRHGPRRALVPMVAAYTALLGLLTVVVWRPGAASPFVLGAVTAAAGACTPPLGPTMRAVWGRIADDRALVQRAYSLDAVAEELLFVSGPLLVGVVIGFAPPALGIVVGAVLIAAGTAGFVASPPVRDLTPGPAQARAKARARGTGRRRVLRGIGRPVIAAAGVGLALGAVELLVVAFAEGHDHGSESVAWVLAALSAGSAVGGLANGAVAWRIPAGLRLSLLAVGLGLALLGAGLAPGLGTLAAAMAVAGLFVAPAITTAYLIADEAAAPEARVQAGAWVNTAVNAGGTAGTAVAGLLVGRLATGWCFAVIGAVTLLAALAVAVARGATRGGGAPEEEEAGEVRDGGAVRAA